MTNIASLSGTAAPMMPGALPASGGAGALGLDFSTLIGAMTGAALPGVDAASALPVTAGLEPVVLLVPAIGVAGSALPQRAGLEPPVAPVAVSGVDVPAAPVAMAAPRRTVSPTVAQALASLPIAVPSETDVIVSAESLPAMAVDPLAAPVVNAAEATPTIEPRREDREPTDSAQPEAKDDSVERVAEPETDVAAVVLPLAPLMVVAPVSPVRAAAVEEVPSAPADARPAVSPKITAKQDDAGRSPVAPVRQTFVMAAAVAPGSAGTVMEAPLVKNEKGVAPMLPASARPATPATAVGRAMAAIAGGVPAQPAPIASAVAGQAPMTAGTATPPALRESMVAVAAPISAGAAMPPAMAMMQDISALLAQAVPDAQTAPAVPMEQVPQAAASTPVTGSQGMVALAAAGVSGNRAEGPVSDAGRGPKRRAEVDDAVRLSAGADPVVPFDPSMIAQARDAMPVAASQAGAAAISGEAALGFHVDAARHGQELDQVARDIVATGTDGAKLSFRLDSHRLGSVGVEMLRQDSGLHVRMESGDATARDMMTDQLQQLVTDARAMGVRIAETSVEAPRRDEPAPQPQGSAPRDERPASQSSAGNSSTGGQSMGGQAGNQAGSQRGTGQQSQSTPGWAQATRGAGVRTDRPAVTPRELYA